MEIRKGTLYVILLYLSIILDIILIGVPEWGQINGINFSAGNLTCLLENGITKKRIYAEYSREIRVERATADLPSEDISYTFIL